ncbi:6-oxocyclohex-1-ene-1-carbonyl-CoA hydratase [Thermomonas sp.]|uniref:6-oxocyclohex-1-ene-1-carbonyl-CoA hydratase n=1 Tax=Thermomonas sp. TaxID=1971895 RepID=UPI002634B77C|nr:6-oxocyclohex-1-ene-1-carbonyl-CoA hydratase [Thermomonas sp.]MBL0227744.1 6-oxocyclohex-1-ene-1-carbonyl-CoA hydratase [Thermomonas sp.]
MKNHHLIDRCDYRDILVEKRPLRDAHGAEVPGLYNAWILLNNEKQLNSYTTQAVKELILAFREASCDRSVVAVVFSAVGDKAFCTGGNTKEYAEYYAGNPQEYKQYMRLFNDMVTGILLCDKPVINRVNGMRIGGGQEIGMACDFSIAADTARFGQAGPKHGSAPDGGSTDFLHLFVGITRAMASCTLCEHWSAHAAVDIGLVNKIVPVLKAPDGRFIGNPMVSLERFDAWGNPAYGAFKSGTEREAAKAAMAGCTTDLSLLDAEVEAMAYKLSLTMPDCLAKTIESVRKKKLEHWQRNGESNRSWLALNMMTEARAGFRAFNEGPRHQREVDFLELRRALAEAHPWDDALLARIMPKA